MKRIALSLMVALLLTFSVVATIGAANPTISITVTARVVSISNTPSSWDNGVVYNGSIYSTGISYFNVTNESNVAVDISISGTNMSGGGYTWVLADDAVPGDMTYGIKAGLDDDGDGTEEQTAYSNTVIIGTALSAYKLGQRLTVSSRTVSGLCFPLCKVGSPSGNITFAIRSVDDDSVIVDKVWGLATDLETDTAWEEVIFDSPTFINEEVRAVCEYDTGNNTDYIKIGVKYPSVKADETETTYQPDWEWTQDPDYDCAYKYTYDVTICDVIVKLNSPYNNLVEGLAEDASQGWGLMLWTPTDYDDGNDKTGTVTITATYSS